jgi:small-conductance mechanosensitive channel
VVTPSASPIDRLSAKLDALLGSSWDWLRQDSGEALFVLVLSGAILLGLLSLLWLGRRLLANPVSGWPLLIRSVLDRTFTLFLAVLALDLATHAQALPAPLLRAIDALFTVVLAVQAALWLRELALALVRRQVAAGGEDKASLGSALGVITVLVNVAVWLVCAVLALDNLGVNVTALVAGLGVGGIAIGLAAQGIFSDLFAALAILFDRPFRVGDTISFGTTTGTVEAIGLKTTRIRALSGEQVIMANTKLLDQQVANLRRIEERRVVLKLAFILATPADVLAGLAADVATLVAAEPECRFTHAMLTGISAYALDYEVVFVVANPDAAVMGAARQRIILALVQLLAARGVQFAYPAQASFTAGPDGRLV